MGERIHSIKNQIKVHTFNKSLKFTKIHELFTLLFNYELNLNCISIYLFTSSILTTHTHTLLINQNLYKSIN